MDEIWKPAPGYEARYEVSSHGRVRSLEQKVRRWQGLVTIKGRILKCGRNGQGYWRMTVSSRPNKHVMVHRLVALAFVPNPRCVPFVNHIDGNKGNCRADNLEWCTAQENAAHAFATGLTPQPKGGKGDACPASKLSEYQVAEIKAALRNGIRSCDLASRYEITRSAIGEIKAGRSWAHVP